MVADNRPAFGSCLFLVRESGSYPESCVEGVAFLSLLPPPLECSGGGSCGYGETRTHYFLLIRKAPIPIGVVANVETNNNVKMGVYNLTLVVG